MYNNNKDFLLYKTIYHGNVYIHNHEIIHFNFIVVGMYNCMKYKIFFKDNNV